MRSKNKNLFLLIALFSYTSFFRVNAQVNLALNRPVEVSSVYGAYEASNAVDGVVSDESRWLSSDAPAWLTVNLDGTYRLGGVHVYTGYREVGAINDFEIQYWSGGAWLTMPSSQVDDNDRLAIRVRFDANVNISTDRVRLYITQTPNNIARVRELTIWEYADDGIPYLGTGVEGYQPSAFANLALNRPVEVSSVRGDYVATNAVDGVVSDASRWLSAESPAWLTVTFDGIYRLGGVHVYTGYEEGSAINDFEIQYWSDGGWLEIPAAQIADNDRLGVRVQFDDNLEVVTDRVRLYVTETLQDIARVRELTVWGYSDDGIPDLGTGVEGYTDIPINLALNRPVEVSSVRGDYVATNAVDGIVSDPSRWLSAESPAWLTVTLDGTYQLGGVHVYSGYQQSGAVNDFEIQFWSGGDWQEIPSAQVFDNGYLGVKVQFDANVDVITDRVRLYITETPQGITRLRELTIWEYSNDGVPDLGTGVEGYEDEFRVEQLPKVFVNQSGYNLDKPKRFTAPEAEENASFNIVNTTTRDVVYNGTLDGLIGDFSDFNPVTADEFMIRVGEDTSFHFGIGMWWLERITYELAVEFMVDSRHYVGNVTSRRRGSFGWRDDHHFAWTLNTLVPQYLSNPSAYERMPQTVSYVPADSRNLWGALDAFDESAPDIVKLIHWGADVIVSQGLTHEHLKAQLAYFLYAWPYLEEWLPQQNYDLVLEYVKEHWDDPSKDRNYPFDQSVDQNLLALKTKMGTTKGELPPGTSVQPNLMVFEALRRDEDPDSMIYMNAAIDQVSWMLENLDWEDSITTKGQRMSEHITMTGFSFFFNEYPEYVPDGMQADVAEWADIMIRRSDNLWDFRKLTDGVNWVPFGDAATQWNEPGNVLGFPACLISVMEILDDDETNDRLYELVYSHMDNAFGRNPVGRHFSCDGASEIEGVDLGWYSFYVGGVGLLENVRFVFDGAPKNEHYPYAPQRGDVGWTEGWIQFNTAYNISLAYMAKQDTELELVEHSDSLEIRLRVPLNFDYGQRESADVQVYIPESDTQFDVTLTEESVNDYFFSGKIVYPEAERIEVSYGYGYMGNTVTYSLETSGARNLMSNEQVESSNLSPEAQAPIKIYPNPTADKVQMIVNDRLIDHEAKLFDISGQEVDSKTIKGSETDWDVSKLKAGFYFIKVSGIEAQYELKLIVE